VKKVLSVKRNNIRVDSDSLFFNVLQFDQSVHRQGFAGTIDVHDDFFHKYKHIIELFYCS
jgi:hypothetical protein